MIALSTVIPGNHDHVYLDTDLDGRKNTARLSRVKTLDGGVYINNGGVSDGDRTIPVIAQVDPDQAATLWGMFRRSENIHIAAADGFFLGLIQSLELNNGAVDMQIWIKERKDDGI